MTSDRDDPPKRWDGPSRDPENLTEPEKEQHDEAAELPLDDEAFRKLHERLRRAVASVCPPWLDDRQADLTQESVLRILEIQLRSEGNRQLSSSYVWKVASSATIDEIRRLRRRREEPLEPEVAIDSTTVVRGSTPEQDLRAHEIAEAIRECLSEMIPPRRRAVVLNLQGHSVPEAARLLGLKVKQTENLVYRGLKDLRKCLSSKGVQP